jgi:hypothetical protein
MHVQAGFSGIHGEDSVSFDSAAPLSAVVDVLSYITSCQQMFPNEKSSVEE